MLFKFCFRPPSLLKSLYLLCGHLERCLTLVINEICPLPSQRGRHWRFLELPSSFKFGSSPFPVDTLVH